MDFFDSVLADQNKERRDRSVHGIAVAKVTGRMGDGTYELSYLGMGGNAPSAPARMMMPNAGNKRGMHWMPETGDEVVVAFEGADSNAPIILGALYNAESPVPDQAKPSNDNNIRTIVSRSGHEITLDDSPSAGKVILKSKEGRLVTLDDTPPGKISLETPRGISIVLDDATGTLSLKAPTAIELDTASLTLNVGGMSVQPGTTPGTGVVSISVPAAVSIQSLAITLTATTMITITAPKPPTGGGVLINGAPF
jgi:phage baseplate assembly protein gpV